MTPLFVAGAALTVVATAALLVAEARGSQPGKWATKPLASAGFLVAAVGAGAVGSGYGRVVVAGLALSMVGDVLLIPKSKQAFLGGLVAFLLGHVAFAVAFALRGLDAGRALVALAVIALVSGLAWRWLSPHVEARMRVPVAAYVVVISSMVATAAGASVHPGGLVGLVGALMFYGSDLAVARNRFVSPGFVNRAWGIPLYFAGQLVIAGSVAG
jgi:uncharacterized membrane protein YhhN